MGNHFIREIEISKFKCFNNFKSSKLARVNLIGGKNNVGKTAFLEGVYINTYSKNVNTLFTVIGDTPYYLS